MAKLRASFGEEGFAERHLPQAAKLFDSITASEIFVDFLTLPAYALLP
jgi:hypothetical protein